MGAGPEYCKSKRDGVAVLEGNRQVHKRKEKNDTEEGVRVTFLFFGWLSNIAEACFICDRGV